MLAHPELTHATVLPGGALPAGSTLRYIDIIDIRRLCGYAVGAWGKSVQGRDAFLKGKPPLTAKSLSAKTV
jgi:hypothetical protein